MKVAAVAITYNDDYKFNEWHHHYLEYRDELFLNIIVDNNSEKSYLEKVKNTFVGSHIIERTTNGGCTGAYNDGISYALSLPEVEAIMLIGNDIRLEKGAITKMYNALMSDPTLGMVAPALLYADSNIVSDFGCGISKTLIMLPYGDGTKLEHIQEDIRYCEALTGGMNLAKREFYEKVGLQDDNLFMYSDEVDMGIRGKKQGFKMAAIRSAVSWHQHINPPGKADRRHPFTKYLGGRNKVYVARKHFGLFRMIYVFLFFVLGALYKILRCVLKGDFSQAKEYWWLIIGAANGLVGNMKPNKYSVPSENQTPNK